MVFRHITKRNAIFLLILLLFTVFLPIFCNINQFSLYSNSIESPKDAPSNLKNLGQTEVLGQTSGIGTPRNSLISTNISETLLNRDENTDFSIYTSNWNVSYTKLSFFNLTAKPLGKTLESDHFNLLNFIFLKNSTWAVPLTVPTSCYLDTAAIYDFAFGVTGFQNVSVSFYIWNATITGYPHKMIAQVTFPNREYMFSSLSVIPLLDAFNLSKSSPVLLNTNLTKMNKFFIGINCTIAAGPQYTLNWFYDNSIGSKESFRWNGTGFDRRNDQNMTMQISLKPFSLHPLPSTLSMQVNSTNILNTGVGAGVWQNSSFTNPTNSRVFYDVSTIWPVSYNMTYYSSIQNRTRFPVQFSGLAAINVITWNVSIQFQTIPQRVANFTANITVPFNWNQTAPRLIRPNNPSISGSVQVYPTAPYSIFKISANAGRWTLHCKGQNYITNISLEKYFGGTFIKPLYSNTTINITDIIRINGTLAYPLTEQTGNLSIFDSLGSLNYSESRSLINGKVSFTPFTFDSFTDQSGYYSLQVSWLNGEQVGIKNLTLQVVYPTSLIVQSPRTEYIVLGVPLNLTVDYSNTYSANKFGETGIANASTICVFGNSTKTNSYSLNQTGIGHYNAIIPTISYAQGNYHCNLTIGKPDRNNISLSLKIELVFNTSLISNLYYAELYYGFNLSLKLNYSRVDTTAGLPGASVNCFIDAKFYSYLLDISNGNYSVRINTSNSLFPLFPGLHQVKINATLAKFMSQQVIFTFKVNATPTDLILYENVTHQAGLRFNLSVAFKTTEILQGKYLPNSSIRCILDDTELTLVSTPAQLDNGNFFLIDFNNGTYNLELLINIGRNRTQTDGTPFKFTVIANQTGYLNGLVNGSINIWVWNTSLVIAYWDTAVPYRNNATINVLYYNTTGKLIDGIISCDFPGNVVIRNAEGNYTVQFNTTGHPAGRTTVTINVTLAGHEWNSATLQIHIIGTPTLMFPYPTTSSSLKINQTLQNLLVTYNETNGQPISHANVDIALSNSTHRFINNTGTVQIYYTYLDGICTIKMLTTGLHVGVFNLTISIENHTAAYAFETNITIVVLTIEPLDSFIIPSLVGSWWSNGALVWFENESILLSIDFIGTFYDQTFPYNDSIYWANIDFKLIKVGTSIPYASGSFISLNNGTFLLNLSLNMPITSLYSNYFENYIIQLNGTAMDCQTTVKNISMRYYAKNLVVLSIILPTDVIEGELTYLSARLVDSFGSPVPNERVTFTLTITFKSGLWTIFSYEAITNANGIATIEFSIPYNIEQFVISAQSEASFQSIASPSETQNFQIYATWYYPVRFLKNTWYIFAIAIASVVATFYYLKKYKPKVAKIESKRETLNYKYISAVNLLHLLVYDRESKELLYVYSSPGLKLTSYLMNSILQSISMYADMPVEFQEVYLQDEICLTLTDAEITRVAVLSKNLPSIEMQKQIQKFIEMFERTFKEKIPEAIKNITAVGRIIDLEFANKLVEECFEKSLTFPHIAVRPQDNVPLSEDENKLHKIAYSINQKSGPFLLGRLLAKAQMESGISELPLLIEIVFKLREKGALQPVSPSEADKLKEEMMHEKLKANEKLKEPHDSKKYP